MEMKTRLRKILGGITLVCAVMTMLAFTAPVKAQSKPVSVVNVIGSGSTGGVLTNSATWAPSTVVYIDGQAFVGLSVRFHGDGSSTSDVVTNVFRSADGVNFETSPPSTLFFTNALNNSTAVVGYFELPTTLVGSARALK